MEQYLERFISKINFWEQNLVISASRTQKFSGCVTMNELLINHDS